MQKHVKEMHLKENQEKEIRKHANNLFDYKIAEGQPIKNMAWKGYKKDTSSKKASANSTAK